MSYLRLQGFEKVQYGPIPWIYHLHPSERRISMPSSGNARLLSFAPQYRHNHLHAAEVALAQRPPAPLKKAHQNGVTVVRDASLFGILGGMNENLEKRFGAKPVHTLQEMELLKSRFTRDIIPIQCLSQRAHATEASPFILPSKWYTDNTVLPTMRERNWKPWRLSTEQIMYHDYPDYPYLDFGSSTEQQGTWINEGLIDHKEGLGGRGVVYDTYEWTL